MDGESAQARHGYGILDRTATRSSRCRCGTPIETGSRCVAVRDVPSSLSSLLRERDFCSIPCIRAYLLEALEVLGSSAAPTMISDFHEVYSSLQTAFAYADFATSSSSYTDSKVAP